MHLKWSLQLKACCNLLQLESKVGDQIIFTFIYYPLLVKNPNHWQIGDMSIAYKKDNK
jgi:hypothetical protein